MKLLVFDLDGTLFDTRQDITAAVNHARRTFGLSELTVAQVTTLVGHGVTVLAQKAFQGTDFDTEVVRDLIMGYYVSHPSEKAHLYPGVADTIPTLTAVLAVVSNKRKLLVDALLEKHEMTKYFDFVAGGDTFGVKKPDPAAIHFLVKKYHAKPAEVLVIGDHSPDIKMAKLAGVRSVFCSYGFFGKDEVGADYEIGAFPELVTVLQMIEDEDKQRNRPHSTLRTDQA